MTESRAASRLRSPDLVPLVDEMVRRFGDGVSPVTITLRDAPASTRRALADLLGADRLPAANRRIRLDRLATALHLDSVEELRAVIEEVRGPIPDRRADREAARAAREALWSWLAGEAAASPLGRDPARLERWVDNQRAGGIRGGLAAHRHLLETAVQVLHALPADGIPLPALANDHAHDPHALDPGRRLSAVVLDALATTLGQPAPADSEAARALWETFGVAPDPHSSTVLAFGVPGGDDTPVRRWLAAAQLAQEPVVLSLSNLRRWPLPALPVASELFVVENPSLVTEAARVGLGSPLVCSSGRPTIATVTLLRQLGAGGATLYQHADFDPAGLSITGWLAERAGTVPWRMTSSDYLAAATVTGSQPTFVTTVPRTPWDPALQADVEHLGVAVYEEELREDLLRAMGYRHEPPATIGSSD